MSLLKGSDARKVMEDIKLLPTGDLEQTNPRHLRSTNISNRRPGPKNPSLY